MRTLLATLRITRKVAVFLFVSFVLLFVLTIHLYWSFLDAGGTLTQSDLIGLVTISTIALFVISFTGWLSFSERGRSLLSVSAEHVAPQPNFVRLIRVLIASAGIATGLWLILIVLSLIVGGPEWVSKMFLPWVLVSLIVLCFPGAYKWLK